MDRGRWDDRWARSFEPIDQPPRYTSVAAASRRPAEHRSLEQQQRDRRGSSALEIPSKQPPRPRAWSNDHFESIPAQRVGRELGKPKRLEAERPIQNKTFNVNRWLDDVVTISAEDRSDSIEDVKPAIPSKEAEEPAPRVFRSRLPLPKRSKGIAPTPPPLIPPPLLRSPPLPVVSEAPPAPLADVQAPMHPLPPKPSPHWSPPTAPRAMLAAQARATETEKQLSAEPARPSASGPTASRPQLPPRPLSDPTQPQSAHGSADPSYISFDPRLYRPSPVLPPIAEPNAKSTPFAPLATSQLSPTSQMYVEPLIPPPPPPLPPPTPPPVAAPAPDSDDSDDIPLALLPRQVCVGDSSKPKVPKSGAEKRPPAASANTPDYSLRSFSRLNPTKSAPELPQAGATFPSRNALHLAASKAAYARGFKVIVIHHYETSKGTAFALACRKSTKEGGLPVGSRCPFKIKVTATTKDDGSEEWKVDSVKRKHNHPQETVEKLGPWKPPQERRKRRRGNAQDGDSGSDASANSSTLAASPPPKKQRSSVSTSKSKKKTHDSESEGDQQSTSDRTSQPPLKHPARVSLPTPRHSTTPQPPLAKPEHPFLAPLTAFLTSCAPSLGAHAPLLLAVGLNSVEAIVEMMLLSASELESLLKIDRRREGGGRSLMELPPLDRAKLKSALKKGRQWALEGVGNLRS